MIPKMQRFSWADLPTDLLLFFLNLLSFTDAARFAAVCKSWRMAAAKSRHFQALQFAWQLSFHNHLPQNLDLQLFSPIEARLHRLDISLSTTAYWNIYGLSMGSLIIHHEFDGNFLQELFTARRIPLPETLPRLLSAVRKPKDAFFKAVLSSPPSAPNLAVRKCIVAALLDAHTLAFCRPGAKSWSVIQGGSQSHFDDIIFFKGLLYSVCSRGEIEVFKFDRMFRHRKMPGYSLTDLTGYLFVGGAKNHCFVKTAAGELFMVVSYWTYCKRRGSLWVPVDNLGNLGQDSAARHPTAIRFRLYMLDPRSRQWTTMTGLGDKMFLLGEDYSVSLDAEKSSEFGFRPNCIYFEDHFGWKEFCFADKKFRKFSTPGCCLKKCRQIWFQLNA